MEPTGLLRVAEDELEVQDHDEVQAPPPRLAFNTIESRTITALVCDPSGTVIANARDRATALAGEDRDGVRLRALARTAAVAEATLQQMNLHLVAALRAHDLDTAKALSKLVDGATRRYCELMAQLGLEGDGARKNPVLFIAAANEVNVGVGDHEDPRESGAEGAGDRAHGDPRRSGAATAGDRDRRRSRRTYFLARLAFESSASRRLKLLPSMAITSA